MVLTTRAAASRNQGGPGQSVHNLLKTRCKLRENNAPLMSAVFADAVAARYDTLQAELQTYANPLDKRSRVSKAFDSVAPASVRAPKDFVVSTLGLVSRLYSAIGKTGGGSLVFHHHDFVPAYLCWLRYRHRYPAVRTIHSKGSSVGENLRHQLPIYSRTPVESILTHMETTSVKEADVVVFPSMGARSLLEQEAEYAEILSKADVRIVYTGVDTDELDSVEIDRDIVAKYGVDDLHTILCVAPFVGEKGHSVLIEAISLLPTDVRSRLRCLLVGKGHLEAELQEAIAHNNLQGTFNLLGFLPRDELLQLIKTCSLFVLPSIVNVFDYALLEAGAAGLPIVTSAIGGNLEMFDSSSALLVPPKDPGALANAICLMLRDEGARAQLGANARKRVRTHFTLDNMLDSYRAIYDELAGRYSRPTVRSSK